MDKNPEKFDELIRQASSAVEGHAAHAPKRPHRQLNSRFSTAVFSVAVALLIWAFLLWGSSISNRQIESDLRTLIQTARDQIDTQIREDGRAPEALADPALARVVRYEVLDAESKPPRYALTAELSGVIERWPTR